MISGRSLRGWADASNPKMDDLNPEVGHPNMESSAVRLFAGRDVLGKAVENDILPYS